MKLRLSTYAFIDHHDLLQDLNLTYPTPLTQEDKCYLHTCSHASLLHRHKTICCSHTN